MYAVYHVSAVPRETRRGRLPSWNWSCRQLLVAMRATGTKSEPSGGADSALNHLNRLSSPHIHNLKNIKYKKYDGRLPTKNTGNQGDKRMLSIKGSKYLEFLSTEKYLSKLKGRQKDLWQMKGEKLALSRLAG